MRRVVLAIDQGTTSVRASIVDASLRVLASAAEAVPRTFPAPGRVDLDAEQMVLATERACGAALQQAGLVIGDVAALGLANQGETAVVWERETGRPIAAAAVWQCRRTEAVCAALRAEPGLEQSVRAETGLGIDPYFSATKIAWLLDSVPGARQRAAAGELLAGTLDSFTLHRWSGGRLHVTDPSTACRTLLAGLSAGRWSDALCTRFAVPRELLPEVVASDADVGSVRICGGEVPVRALLCDQPAALLGTGCHAPGEGKCTYGTGAFVQICTGNSFAVQADGLLRSIAWEIAGTRTYLLEGGVLAAGDVLSWLRDDLGILPSLDAVGEALQARSDPGVAFLPALGGLGAPYWNGRARGMMVGLHRGTRGLDLVRAALEGIAHLVADVLDAAAAALGGSIAPLWADGGIAGCDPFLQLQADLAGKPLRRGETTEATTRGVAALALAGAGLVPSLYQAVAQRETQRWEPGSDAAARLRLRERHKALVELATRWARETPCSTI